jgi:hypothetical protein
VEVTKIQLTTKKNGKNTMHVANSRFAKISMTIQKNQTSLVTIDFESQNLGKSSKTI